MATQPPIVCNLDAKDMGDRTSEWNSLLSQASDYHRTKDGIEVTFASDTKLQETAQDLAKREKDCCPFFTFTFSDVGTSFKLTATAPPDAQFVFEAGGWSKLATQS